MSLRTLTVSWIYHGSASREQIPAIRIQGRWLEKLGFKIGDKIEITEKNEEIIIRLGKEKPS